MLVSEPYVTDLGIVLKRIPFKDSDAHMVVFGRALGKIVALAKGLGKPTSKLSSILDVGNLVTVDLYDGKNGYTLLSATQAEGFARRYHSYEALLTSVYLCELVDEGMVRAAAEEAVFVLLQKVLQAMDDSNVVECRLYFEWQFLALAGYLSREPEDVRAAIAATQKTPEPSPQAQAVADEVAAFIHASDSKQRIEGFRLSKPARALMRSMVNRSLQTHLGLSLKSKKILDEATMHFYS